MIGLLLLNLLLLLPNLQLGLIGPLLASLGPRGIPILGRVLPGQLVGVALGLFLVG
jgi:hypothetical protein